LAANYQPSTSPSARKIWAAYGLPRAGTAATSAVPSLFSAVLVEKPKSRKKGTTSGDRFHPKQYHSNGSLSIKKFFFRTTRGVPAGRHCGRVLNHPYEPKVT
jgi:hypothetical protein